MRRSDQKKEEGQDKHSQEFGSHQRSLRLAKTRTLGRMGFEISEIGFGAWAIGGKGYGEIEERQSLECLETYLEAGGNFIDTARGYGESERFIGQVLHSSGMSDNIYIASKTGRGRTKETISEIREDLETTLGLLQREYVDLYYLHHPPDDPDLMDLILDEYEQFKQEGKIHAIGASIRGPNVTQHTVDLCRQYIATGRVDALQVIYSIFRQKNAEMFAEARQHGVGIVARTVLESGFLTGKYQSDHIFTAHRKRWGERRLRTILEHVNTLQDTTVIPPYSSLGQVAIRFVLQHPDVTTAIIGAKTAAQTHRNIEVEHLPLLAPEIISRLKADYADFTEYCNTGE